MRVLLDTHVLYWAYSSPDRIPAPVQAVLTDVGNELVWSAIGTAELAIKTRAGRLRLPGTLEAWMEEQRDQFDLEILDVENRHALRLATLPRIHRDPFDRLLVAQAQVEGIPLVTSDKRLRGYEVEVIW